MISKPRIGDTEDLSDPIRLSEGSESNLAVLDQLSSNEDLEVVLVEGFEEVVLDFGEGREDGLRLRERQRWG